MKWRPLAILALSLVAIPAKAQVFTSSLDVSKPWCFTVDLAAPDDKGFILTVPQLYWREDGNLVAILPKMRYVTDAVIKGINFLWLASRNGGITWEELKDRPPEFVNLNPYRWPLRALKLSDRNLLATASYGWENFPESEREKLASQGYYLFDHAQGNARGTVSIIRKVLMARSKDRGKTWKEEEIKLPFMPHLALYGNAIVLRDGTYVQPAWGRFDLKKEPKWVSSLALRSEDGGEHWEIATVAKARDFDFGEASIAEAPNGDLVAVIRTTAQKELWTALSKDRGKSWLPPRDSGMRGSTPCVVTTNRGLVVAVYARRSTNEFPNTGVFACVSRDNGQTWDIQHESMLRDHGTAFVDGYPQAVALPDGSVFAIYALLLSIPDRTAEGGVSSRPRLSIGGTRFSPAYQGPPRVSFEQQLSQSH